MKLVYSFNINNDNSILELCQVSKCLYNQALYEIKENLKINDKFLFYKDLDKIMKCEYLEFVIKETLRLHSPAPNVF